MQIHVYVGIRGLDVVEVAPSIGCEICRILCNNTKTTTNHTCKQHNITMTSNGNLAV